MSLERINAIDERMIVEVVRQVLEAIAREQQTRGSCGSCSKSRTNATDKPNSKAADCGCGCGGTGACRPQVESAPKPAQPTGDWPYQGQVLSVRDIAGRPTGTRRVLVTARTIVTPAARDEIKDRGLELVRVAPSNAAANGSLDRASGADQQRRTPCFSQAHPGKFDPQLLGLPLQVVSAEGWADSDWAERVAPRVARDGQAIVIALEPYVAVCELNRAAGIRAGYAPTTTALGKLIHQLRPNVVVVDARRFTHAMLRAVLEELESQPPRSCGVSASMGGGPNGKEASS